MKPWSYYLTNTDPTLTRISLFLIPKWKSGQLDGRTIYMFAFITYKSISQALSVTTCMSVVTYRPLTLVPNLPESFSQESLFSFPLNLRTPYCQTISLLLLGHFFWFHLISLSIFHWTLSQSVFGSFKRSVLQVDIDFSSVPRHSIPKFYRWFKTLIL